MRYLSVFGQFTSGKIYYTRYYLNYEWCILILVIKYCSVTFPQNIQECDQMWWSNRLYCRIILYCTYKRRNLMVTSKIVTIHHKNTQVLWNNLIVIEVHKFNSVLCNYECINIGKVSICFCLILNLEIFGDQLGLEFCSIIRIILIVTLLSNISQWIPKVRLCRFHRSLYGLI